MIITSPHGEIKAEYIRLIAPTYRIYAKQAIQSAIKPYVIIQEVSDNDEDNKDCEGYEITVQLLICTDYQGEKQSDEISSAIQKLIFRSKLITNVTLTDFNIHFSEISSNKSAGETIVTPTQSINNKILIIKHHITEKL